MNPRISLEGLLSILKVSLRTTKSIVSVLKSNGTISRINGKKYGSWIVNDNN